MDYMQQMRSEAGNTLIYVPPGPEIGTDRTMILRSRAHSLTAETGFEACGGFSLDSAR